jgi:hypothetical protein
LRFESRNGRHRNCFKDFEANGISQKDLDRIKAGRNKFLSGLASVNGFQLAQYEIFAGTPDFINQDVKIFWQLALPMSCEYTIHTSKTSHLLLRVLFQREQT